MPSETHIPEKLYYRIGEVTDITGLAAYVLRFWESEFKNIHPKRTESGQRLYRRADIEAILQIKHLLYEKKFTIEGAKKQLKGGYKKKGVPSPPDLIDDIRMELMSIRELLRD